MKKSISEQGLINEQTGIFSKKIINEQGQIRASRMEKSPQINKRACSLIRQLGVSTYPPTSLS